MTLSWDIRQCSGSAETCPAMTQAFEADAFYESVADMDPTAEVIRYGLGQFVTGCVNGNCPGRNLELTEEILRSQLHRDE